MNYVELLRKLSMGTASIEEKEFYKQKFMSDFEKSIGKPFWDFTREEDVKWEAYEYNNSVGGLYGYDCKACKNRGQYATVEGKVIVYEPCKCMIIRDVIRKMEQSGLGNLLKRYTFDNYESKEDWQKNIKIKALTFVSSNANAFVILGQSGAGKTHICTAISKALLEQGRKLKYMIWVDEATELKRTVNEKEYSQKIQTYKDIDVLYIDDFFKTQRGTEPTTADIRLAYEIINTRYNKKLTTIVSSERTLAELKEIDEAIAGRLVEMSKEFLIVLQGFEKNQRFLKKV